MSMLAEPRRKQKWTLNPRGKQWSEDSNKFGQKMLEKMGWTVGKGLGASEQGMTEHVRVSLKNDNSGIGFKKDALDEAWTEHQDSYNEFLKQLQENEDHNVVKIEENDVLSGKSLELKSKQSRARVHYHKFTRGKDVNKYSSKDLANIFGQKELNIIKKERDKESAQGEKLDEVGKQDNRGGVITINGGNMAEYFMKKGQQFTSVTKKEQEGSESESELTRYVGFGFSAEVQRETKSVDGVEELGKKGENKKGRRQKENTCSTYAFENPCIQLDSPEITSNSSESKSFKRKSLDDIKSSPSKKIKKVQTGESVSETEYGIVNVAMDLDVDNEMVNGALNGKEFEVPRVQFGLTNTGLDLSDETNVKKRRVTFNDRVEYSSDPIKKKKKVITLDKFEVENTKLKKKKSKDKKKDHHVHNDTSISSGFVNEALELVEEPPMEVNGNEVVNKKKKKSKDKKRPKSDDDNYTQSGFVNEALDLASLEKSAEVNDNEINEIRCESVRKKRSRRSNLETIVEIPEEDGLVAAKGAKVEDDVIEIDNSIITVDSNQEQGDGAKKKKKKCKENIADKSVMKIEDKRIILEPGNIRLEDEDEQNINEEKKIMDILQDKKKDKDSDQVGGEVQDDTEVVKPKKKKKKKENQDKSIDQDSEIKPEIDGNKENDVHEEFTEIELKKKKKKKKDKEDNDLDVSKTNDLNKLEEGTPSKEISSNETELTSEPKENSLEVHRSQGNNTNATQSTEFTNNKNRNRFSNNNRRSSNSNNDNSNSPWNQRARVSKKLLVSLFNRNSVHNFPGSNMDEIKGYGVQ